MKKNLAVVAVILLLICLTSCTQINNMLFENMDNLPRGTFQAAYDSLSKIYTLNIYLCEGNATTDFSIRGELVNNNDKSKKNIYWNYHENSAEVEWVDDEIVIINGRRLNVLKDYYDFRTE